MFKEDYEIAPKTYAIKSYRIKQAMSLKKIIIYLTLIAAAAGISWITVLSAANLI